MTAAWAIGALKPLSRHTRLDPDGAAIAFPDLPEYRQMAQRLALDLHPLVGGALPLLPLAAEAAAPKGFPLLLWPTEPAQLVLLGNAIDNPLILRLYLHHFTLTDGYFPGPGGHFLETVHNPWGDGRNAVLAGGSDLAGVEQAARALVEAVARLGPVLPPLRLGTSERIASVPGSAEDRRHLRAWRRHQLQIGDLPWPTNDYAYLYYLTGDPYWGELFAEILRAEIQAAQEDGRWPRTLFDNYFNQYRMVLAWDMVEESEAFTDEDRLAITNLLHEVGRWVRDLPYFAEEPYRGSNHQTYACLSLWQTRRYFARYYGRQDFAGPLPLVEAVFALHRQSFRSPDDEPSTYLRMPRHVLCHDLQAGCDEYLHSGRLARLAEEIVQFLDNRGQMCAFGDCGEYDTVHTLGPWDLGTQSRVLSLLGTAAWYYRRPDFAWAERFARRGLDWRDRLHPPMIYCRGFSQLQRYGCHGWELQVPALRTGMAEEEPRQLLGVVACRLDEAGVELVTTNRHSPSPLPVTPVDRPEELFSALTFRRSFQPADEYLCLHGVATLNHSHHHANCVLRLTWRDRIVLAEGDEMKALRRYHNGLVVVRNGEHRPPPGLARLQALACFPHAGFSRTLLEGDNGLDWERNVLWCPGHFFAFVDRCVTREPGEYRVEARWLTLGQVELRGQALRILQDGEEFALVHAGDGDLDLLPALARYGPDREAYRGYRHATDGHLRLLCQSQRRAAGAGEAFTFVNLVCPAAQQPPAWELTGESVARLGGEHPCLAGRADEGWASAGVEVLARLFVLSGDGLAGVGVARVALDGELLFTADPPVDVELDLRRGLAIVEAAEESLVWLRAEAVRPDRTPPERAAGTGCGQRVAAPSAGPLAPAVENGSASGATSGAGGAAAPRAAGAPSDGMVSMLLPPGRHELHLQGGPAGVREELLRGVPALPAAPAPSPGELPALAVDRPQPGGQDAVGRSAPQGPASASPAAASGPRAGSPIPARSGNASPGPDAPPAAAAAPRAGGPPARAPAPHTPTAVLLADQAPDGQPAASSQAGSTPAASGAAGAGAVDASLSAQAPVPLPPPGTLATRLPAHQTRDLTAAPPTGPWSGCAAEPPAAGGAACPSARPVQGAPSLEPAWHYDLGAPITALSAAGSRLALGDARGQVALLDALGREQLRCRVPEGVTCLLLCPQAGGLWVGTRDTRLLRHDLQGACRWERLLERGYRQRPREVRALAWMEPTSTDPGVLLAGCADEALLTFSPEGEERWQVRVPHHAITLLLPFAAEDGARRIVAGSEYFHVNLLDAQGQVLWQSWRGPATAAVVADVDGDGQAEVAWGDWLGVRVHRATRGEVLWDCDLGGETVGLVRDPAQPRLWAASDVGQVVCLGPDGPSWRRDAAAPVTCLAHRQDPFPVLLLGTRTGCVQARSPETGELEAVLRTGQAVHALCPGPGMVWVVGARGEVVGLGAPHGETG
ncbi:MAG: hypothetical protein AB1505_09125 [Candidatus Latescibacterota bacterium]